MVGCAELISNNIAADIKETEQYRVAYTYFVESDVFARLDASEEDIQLANYNTKVEYGLTGKETTLTVGFLLYGGNYQIICHENESGWYVCADCTQVK